MWVVSFTPRPLYLRERAPGIHWIGGWVGPRAVLDAMVMRKDPSPRREWNPRTPIFQPAAQRYTVLIQNGELVQLDKGIPELCYTTVRQWSNRAAQYVLDSWQGHELFSLHHSVQTGSGAHPTSCPMATGSSFPGRTSEIDRIHALVLRRSYPLYEGRLQSSWTYLTTPSRNLWRCGDGLFFEILPLACDSLLTTLHSLLENGVKVTLKESFFRMAEQPQWNVSVALLKSGNGCAHRDRWNPIRTSAIQSRTRPMRFLSFSNHEKGAPRSKLPAPLSSWSLRQTVCSTFSRSGWSVVTSLSLTKGGTSKKRPSPHLHKVPTRNNKVRPRILQTALVSSLSFSALTCTFRTTTSNQQPLSAI
jgi:hypothetical protein